MISLNEAIGDWSLSAWQPVRGVVWVQTPVAAYAGKLSSRSDSRLVSQGVHGGYMRVFEFEGKSMAWAARLVERYSGRNILGGTGANGPRICLDASPSAPEPQFDHSVVSLSRETKMAESSREAALA